MSDKTGIQWTDSTWNPVRGCTRISTGCGGPHKEGGCYAEKLAARFSDPGQPYHGFAERTKDGGRWTGKVELIEDVLTLPLRWKKPRKIFVNSMSDLFHEKLSDEAIDKIFAVMALCPQHTFQVLTKRAERMREYMTTPYRHDNIGDHMMEIGDIQPGFKCVAWPFSNVWLGVSCERQQEADERIPLLLQTSAAVRFVSCEPLLGPLDLYHGDPDPRLGGHYATKTYIGDWWPAGAPPGVPSTHGLDWVIAGGESGPNARPAHPDWFRSLRDQCLAADVAFFFKQFGEFCPAPPLEPASHAIFPDGSAFRAGHVMGATDIDAATSRAVAKLAKSGAQYARITRVGKKRAGRILDGREHNSFPVTDDSVFQDRLSSHDHNKTEDHTQ